MESLEKILALHPTLSSTLSNREKRGLADKKNEHYKTLITSAAPENILPGIKTLLKQIKDAHINIALGSASKNAETIVKQLGLVSSFDYMVDAAEISKGKPHPETFTTAADYFGLSYQDCIGVEDATAGIEAINRANMFSIG